MPNDQAGPLTCSIESFTEQFFHIFRLNGLDAYCTQPIAAQFFTLTELMLEKNRVMNVTALTTLDKIIPLHYADCCLIANLLPLGATVADIGCGGGFPTLPLAIVRPDLHITGIDSTEKKVRYVEETARALHISKETVTTLSGRAEELARLPEHRDRYDAVISRAVARLSVLNELCLPFVKPQGIFLAMKGAAAEEELQEAQKGIVTLGGTLEKVLSCTLFLEHTQESRTMISIRKLQHTSPLFPRSFGKIKKVPL